MIMGTVSYGQTILSGEYFFDTDPGFGNGYSFNFTTPADSVETTLTIPTSGLGLAIGLHVLYIRTLNDSGKWSFAEPRMVNIIHQSGNTSIAEAEYFFDTDPGIGAGTDLALGAAADSVEFNPQLPTTGLLNGLHVLYIRTKNTANVWSLAEPRLLNIIQVNNAPVMAAEYFFDTDPGIGSGNSISVGAAADSVEFMNTVPTGNLGTGLHVLYIRTLNTAGVWSLSEPRMVNIVHNVINHNIIAGEYFIDTDPGVGAAIPFNTGAAADSIEITANLPVDTALLGDHYVYMRTKNTANVWSLSEGRLITVFPCLPSANITNPNDTVAFCSGNPISLSADTTGAYGYLWSTGDTTQTISLDTGGVITVEVFDSFGCSALDTIYSNLSVGPAFTNCADITVYADSAQCGALVDFSALGLTGTPVPLTTYTQNPNTFFPVGTTVVSASAVNSCSTASCDFSVIVIDTQGPTIIAPATANFTLSGTNCSVSNPVLGSPVTNDNCGAFTVSNNAPTEFFAGTTLVTWTIDDGSGNMATAYQNVNVSGNVNFGLALNASSTNLTGTPMEATFTNNTPDLSSYIFTWYFGDGTMLASNAASVSHTYYFNGIYTVTLVATNVTIGCSDTLVMNNYITCNVTGGPACSHMVSTNPSGVLNACAGSIVPLAGTTSAVNPVYQWNRNGVIIGGASQSNYDVSQSGNYSLTVFDASGCPVTSSIVQVNYNLPGSTAPTISGVGNPGPCGNVSMQLTANGSFSTYLWSTGQSGSTITVTQGGSFTVTGQSPACDAVSLPFNVAGSFAPVPPICMVTVDETDNKNVIIWEKPVTLQIDSFVIVREEINTPGVYTAINNQAYADLSEFKDTGSYADVRAYRYKLAVVDTCGGYTIPSSSQRSMHLDVMQGNSVLARQLTWNVYQGQQQAYTHYLIYRETAPGNLNLQLIDSVPSTQTWYYDNTLTNIIDTNRAYMVGYRITTPCISSRAANQICQSNVTSIELPVHQGPDGLTWLAAEKYNFSLQPNPNNGIFNLRVESNMQSKTYHLTIFDMLGNEVYADQHITTQKTALNLSYLANGVYTVKFGNGLIAINKRLVIAK